MAVLVHCEKCGKLFSVTGYKFWLRQHGLQRSLCCSRDCAQQIRQGRPVPSRQRRVSLTCAICGKTFEETAVHAQERRFCSHACKAEYQRTALQDKGNPYYGRKHSEDTRRKISVNHFRWYGEDNPNWHGGITELKILIRKSKRYKEWRIAVFKRDGFRSVHSGKRGQRQILVAHHIKPFIEILNEMLAQYPDLSPEKDKVKLFKLALKYEPLWTINNGITLLRDEHHELHYGIGSDDEDD